MSVDKKLSLSNLQNDYKSRILPALQQKYSYSNVHQVPHLVKVVVNTCVASSTDIKVALENAKEDISLITGQCPVKTVAKQSISNFKLRAGQAIGLKVTLRGRMMYEFLERLVTTALPRIRDFKGIPVRSFDGNGNYTLGITDHSIFPEIELDKIKKNIGFDITIVTSTSHDNEAKDLLSEIGFPFSGQKKVKPKIVDNGEITETNT